MSRQSPARILALAPCYSHPDWRSGGVARSSADTAMALARRGHTVAMISPLVDGELSFDMPTRREYEDGRLSLHYVPSARTTRLGTTASGLQAVMQPLVERFDIVHVHSFMSPWTDRAATIARRAGRPYVVQPRGKMTGTVLEHRAGAKRAYLALRGWRLLEDAARTIFLADAEASTVRRLRPSVRIAICPNGLDPDEYAAHPARPIDEPYFLFLGWIDPRKNPDLLVRAFARVADTIAPWKLALVGPDTYGQRAALDRLIAEKGLEERVVRPGLVRGTEKLSWLRNADAFVLPSDGEGLSLAMLEAVACGLPCLLSEGCHFGEIERAAAGEILPLDDDAWADAMRSWASNPDRLREAGQNARHLFETQFTIDRIAARLGEIYDEILAERDRSA